MALSFESCPPSLAEEAPLSLAEEAQTLSFESYLQGLTKKPSLPSAAAVAIASSQDPQSHQEPEAPPRQEPAQDPQSHQDPEPS